MEAINSDSELVGGTLNGSVSNNNITAVEGVRGNGLYLDGTGFVNLGNSRDSCFFLPDLCPDGFTMAFWLNIYPKAGTDLYYISNGGQTTSSFGIAVWWSNGLGVSVKTKLFWQTVANIPFKKNVWNYVVFTRIPGRVVRVYLNGTFAKQTTDTFDDNQPTSSFNNYLFGAPNNANNFLQGEAVLDDILFWEHVKDPQFIKTLSKQTSPLICELFYILIIISHEFFYLRIKRFYIIL